VDFLRLRPGSSLRVDVPVHFITQDICPGIKKGGALNIVLHAIEMRVPADAIPDAITIDLAKADINDSLYLSSVALPDGCKAMVRTKGEVTVANITPPVVVEEAPVVAAAPAKGKAAAKPAAKK
jgi:large subunit ribosomal protein L25